MRSRLIFAWTLLGVAIVGWPLSALTIFANEPQGILGLSWLAIILTAVDILSTTDTRKAIQPESPNPNRRET